MSHARCRIEGTTYGLAIRCAGRHCYLVPTLQTTSTLHFLLAHYAGCYGIEVHGYAFLSTHYHLVVTDTRGLLGAFMRDLNSQVARILNFRLERRENLFSRDGYEAWQLDTEDVVGHLAYLAANPVEAGLVRDPADWPGLLSLPASFSSGPRRAYQPEQGFYGRGRSKRYPEFVDLELTLPPNMTSEDTFVRDFQRQLDARVQAALRSRRSRVWPPISALRSVDPHWVPPGETRPDFQVRPHLAKGASPERKRALQAWREAYKHAIYAWKAGVRDVQFPPGTYLMRHLHKARVAPRA